MDVPAQRADEATWQTLAASAPIGIFASDSEGRCTFANPRAEAIYGLPVHQVVGMALLDGVHPDDRDLTRRAWRRMLAGRAGLDVELRIVQPGGAVRWCHLKASLLPAPGPDGTAAVGSLDDVTEARAARAVAEAAQARFRAAFDGAPVGMAVLAVDGTLEQQNPAWRLVTGSSIPWPPPRLAELFDGDDARRVDDGLAAARTGNGTVVVDELTLCRGDGETRWVQLHVSVLPPEPDADVHLLAQLVDLTARRQLELQLRTLADRDPLTGTWNRRSFERFLDERIELRRASDRGAMLMLDLDRFKAVNDTLGHRVGDEVLAGVAAVLQGRLRSDDVIARLGGDEFAIALPGTTLAEAIVVATNLLEAVERFAEDRPSGVEQLVSASIGIALWDGGDEPAEILAEADRALYAAKSSGRNRWALAGSTRRANAS